MSDEPKKRASGPSGKHVHPVRRIAGMPTEEWEAQSEHAKARGLDWSKWARAALAEAFRRESARSKKES